MKLKKIKIVVILLIIASIFILKSSDYITDYFKIMFIKKGFEKIEELSDKNELFTYYDERLKATTFFFIPRTIEETKNFKEEFFKEFPIKHQNIIHNQLAYFYYKRKLYELSAYYIEKAIKDDNQCYVCYSNRGLIHMQMNKLQEALNDFKYSLAIKKSAESFYSRHLLYKNYLNLKDKAIADLISAIKTEEKHIKSKYSLFFIYINDSKISEAKEILNKIKKNFLLDKENSEHQIKLRIQLFEEIISYSQNKLNGDSTRILDSIEIFLNKSSAISDIEEYLLILEEIKYFTTIANSDIEKTRQINKLIDKNYQESLDNYIKILRTVNVK